MSDKAVGELVKLSQAHAKEDKIDMCFSRHVQENLLWNVEELWIVKDRKKMVGAICVDYKPEVQIDDREKWERMRQHYGEIGPVDWLLALIGQKRRKRRGKLDTSGVIEFFAVEPKYRSKGVSKKLFTEVEKAMGRKRKTHVYFLTAVVSKTTKKFLDEHGFEEKPLPLVTKFLRRLEGIRESHLFECRL